MNKAILALLMTAGLATPALAEPPSWGVTQVRHDNDRRGNDRQDWQRGNRSRDNDRRDNWQGRDDRSRDGDRRDNWQGRDDRSRQFGRNGWDRDWRGNDRRDQRIDRRWDRDDRRDRHWDRDDRRWSGDDRRFDRGNWREWRRWDYYRPDPRYGRYYPDYYYRDRRFYQPWRLGYRDRIYRGYDGRYYCRRSDGTTGLILGAIGGGLLGDALTRGDSSTVGALIGGAFGALIGREIDRDGVRCW